MAVLSQIEHVNSHYTTNAWFVKYSWFPLYVDYGNVANKYNTSPKINHLWMLEGIGSIFYV